MPLKTLLPWYGRWLYLTKYERYWRQRDASANRHQFMKRMWTFECFSSFKRKFTILRLFLFHYKCTRVWNTMLCKFIVINCFNLLNFTFINFIVEFINFCQYFWKKVLQTPISNKIFISYAFTFRVQVLVT